MKKYLTVVSVALLLLVQGCTLSLQNAKTLSVRTDPTRNQAVTTTVTVTCHDYFLVWNCQLDQQLNETK